MLKEFMFTRIEEEDIGNTATIDAIGELLHTIDNVIKIGPIVLATARPTEAAI